MEVNSYRVLQVRVNYKQKVHPVYYSLYGNSTVHSMRSYFYFHFLGAGLLCVSEVGGEASGTAAHGCRVQGAEKGIL
jgi:hypothetical protein